VFIYT